MLDDATLDIWAASDDPVRRQHAANFRALREGRTVGSPASPTFPPLAEQAGNLAGAAARFVASGLKQATPAEQARRLSICEGCDRLVDGRCSACGCVTAWKARLQSEHCPLPEPKW